jgi:DNA gyrase/topoisomerase IV subunit B
LITHGMVYIACPPLYRVYKKSDPAHKFIYAWDDKSARRPPRPKSGLAMASTVIKAWAK